MFDEGERAAVRKWQHFGHHAMSDLSPECVERVLLAQRSALMRSRWWRPWVRQNNPTGKISLNASGKLLLQIRPSQPARGAYRDRHETRDGMRWTRRHRARDGTAGRVLRSVSGHRTRGRAMLKRTVNSCGPDASAVGVKSCGGAESPTGPTCQFPGGDGGKKARHSGESAP